MIYILILKQHVVIPNDMCVCRNLALLILAPHAHIVPHLGAGKERPGPRLYYWTWPRRGPPPEQCCSLYCLNG